MLEAVVEQNNVNAGGFETKTLRIAIGADAELDAITEVGFHELNFVAAAIASFVPTAENPHTLAMGEKTIGQPDDHGSFAGTTQSYITNTDDWGIQAFGAEEASFIEPSAKFDNRGVQHG